VIPQIPGRMPFLLQRALESTERRGIPYTMNYPPKRLGASWLINGRQVKSNSVKLTSIATMFVYSNHAAPVLYHTPPSRSSAEHSTAQPPPPPPPPHPNHVGSRQSQPIPPYQQRSILFHAAILPYSTSS